MEGRKEGWMDGWMDQWMDGRKERRKEGRKDGWMDGCINVFVYVGLFACMCDTHACEYERECNCEGECVRVRLCTYMHMYAHV